MTDTRVELEFADGSYEFWLPLPQATELERKCGNKSLFAIYDGLSGGIGLQDEKPVYLGGGSAMATEIREVIRLGLIGGGAGMVDDQPVEVGPQTARQLVDDYVYPARPMIEGAHTAWAILHAAITGITLKKKAEPVKGKSRSRSPRAKS